MKKVLMLLMAMFITLSSFGQKATKNTGVFENTFVSVQGGASTPLDFNSVFPLNGNAGIKIGKWITPIVGVNVEGDAWFGSNHFSDSKTAVRASNVGLNGMIDITNLFGFKPYRTFSIIPEAGLGWLHHYNTSFKDNDDLSAKTGLILNFRTSKALSIYAEPVVWWNLNNRIDNSIQFNKNHSQLGLQVGIVYHFKNRDNTRTFTQYNISDYINQINSLRNELSKKPKEIIKELVKEVNVVDTITFRNAVVFFAQGSSTITDYSDLDKVATGSKVEVHGYASPEGSDELNLKLSEDRANAVANYLRAHGVTVTEVIGHGATNSSSNRVVLVY